MWSEYHTMSGGVWAHWDPTPVPPLFLGADAESVAFLGRLMPVWSGVVTPPGGFPTLSVSVRPIRSTTGFDNRTHGFLLWGAEIRAHVDRFANAGPVCTCTWEGANVPSMPPDASAELPALTPLPIATEFDVEQAQTSSEAAALDTDMKGFANVVVAGREIADSAQGRTCPPRVPPLTSELSYTFFVLRDRFAGHPLGTLFRLDSPRSVTLRGTAVLGATAGGTTGVLVLLAVVCGLFLEFYVLRRLDSVRRMVSEITSKVRLGSEEDESSGAGSHTDRRRHQRPGSMTSSVTSGEEDLGGGDEIGNLGNLAERRVEGLRLQLEKLSAELEKANAAGTQHRDAMRLLNMWSGRPQDKMATAISFAASRAGGGGGGGGGVAQRRSFQLEQPAAMPTEGTLADLLGNPIATQFLKEFCTNEGSIGNLMFLLDVAWLRALERAKADPDIVAEATARIRAGYLSRRAKMHLSVSSAVRKRLVRKKSEYIPKMFDAAVAEVVKLITSEVLPKFRKSIEFEAMKIALEIDGTAFASSRAAASRSQPGIAPRSLGPDSTRRPGFIAAIKQVVSKMGGADELAGIEHESESGSDTSSTSSEEKKPPAVATADSKAAPKPSPFYFSSSDSEEEVAAAPTNKGAVELAPRGESATKI